MSCNPRLPPMTQYIRPSTGETRLLHWLQMTGELEHPDTNPGSSHQSPNDSSYYDKNNYIN